MFPSPVKVIWTYTNTALSGDGNILCSQSRASRFELETSLWFLISSYTNYDVEMLLVENEFALRSSLFCVPDSRKEKENS